MALPLRDPQVLGVTVCALAKVAKAVIKIAGALAAAAVMFLAIWLAIKAPFLGTASDGHALANQPGTCAISFVLPSTSTVDVRNAHLHRSRV
jgi:hypothetical protein